MTLGNDNGTDGQTDRRTDRVRRIMWPPPREEGRIIKSTVRVDYCNSVLVSAPKRVSDELQRVTNAAARLISDTDKYDRELSQLLHEDLYWLHVPQASAVQACCNRSSLYPESSTSVPR